MENINKKLEEINKLLKDEKYSMALELLKPLINEENAQAIGIMGFLYQLGLGIERDGLKAVSCLKRAIELGDGVSAHNLGTLYLSDLPGVPKDAKLSKFYYRKAKEMGAQFADDKWYE